MKITAIIENTSPDPNLITEPGLALYIEMANKRILFDTGVSGNIIGNAKKLNIPLEQIDACIISHGHFDHTGGLEDFLKINSKASVYMKPSANGAYIFKLGPLKKNIAVPSNIFTDFKDRIKFIDKKSEIMPGVMIITDIKQTHPLGKQNAKFFIKTDTGLVKDTFTHELIVLLTENNKSVAITGCSHNGIQNMIDSVKVNVSNISLNSVFGGFHLMTIPLLKNSMAGTPEEIRSLGKALLAYDIPKIYTMHCTGQKAYGILKQEMGNRLEYMPSGLSVTI